MNSCLYECDIMHYRLEPKKNRFVYKVFMFYLDLDEVDAWAKKLWFLSHNRINIFNFKDSDHLRFASPRADAGPLLIGEGEPFSHREKAPEGPDEASVKENILRFIRSKGVEVPISRIMLLTHLRTFGHLFNPVSFYFCFDRNDHPVCAVAEVGNTFREMKPFLLSGSNLRDGTFESRVAKNFYVSPFMDLDVEFDFRLGIPGETLSLHIDDYKEGKKVLLSSVTGPRVSLSDGQLSRYILRFPVITLKVIALIHWQALVLWLKGVPYFKKAANPHLQQEVYNARHL